MTDITFITSNQAKVAHARYLCRNYDVNILTHKRMYYGVGYTEPRINDRETLLKESFDDAVRRWQKNVSNYGERLFFIEDTSVKIDALSDDNSEVPGVDIKYWMRENDFRMLDSMLKANGNNRKVSVSSHIVLFLTNSLKEKLGTDVNYKVFKSTSIGRVVDREQVFETQILYPWLDDKSFNKWFVPDGFSVPISALSIRDADKGDFRKAAFEEMLSFLVENGEIHVESKLSFDLPLQFNNNFIVCGRTCSGKTTIGNMMVYEYGYYHIEASDFMTQRYHETHGAVSRIDRHVFALEMLRTDPTFVVDRVIDYMVAHSIYDMFVVTGFRSAIEVRSFMDKFRSIRTSLIYINADENTRYNRWLRRKRDTEIYSKDRFLTIDEVQKEVGVTTISQMGDVSFFNNNKDGLQYLYEGFIKAYMADILKCPLKTMESIYDQEKLSLEKTILITLATANIEDQNRFFTTTEIAKRINNIFRVTKKNKNNVSRYFNQAFYVYYEVRYEGNRIKYKISPTGYSEAVSVMRRLQGAR